MWITNIRSVVNKQVNLIIALSNDNSCCISDEKEKYDPTGFRDSIIQGLDKAGTDLEAISKFLDTAGSKLDYRRYGEALFDILIAGGLLGKLHLCCIMRK